MNRVIIVLTALALLAACTETTASDPARTGPTVTVLQLNICHGGMNKNCYRGDAVLTKAAEVIRSSKPHVLSVNEACSRDIDRLRPAMGSARALFVAARNLDDTPTLCGDGDQYGNIIMVADEFAGTTEETGTYPAQYRAADGVLELRSWACLPAAKLTACTTHLSSDNAPTALAQCQDLTHRAAGYPRPTIVAGDFNLKDQGSPSMRDCDPAGFSRRGDDGVQYVYASDDLTFSQVTKIDMTGTTDHPGLLTTLQSS
jgi:hypothetical protein